MVVVFEGVDVVFDALETEVVVAVGDDYRVFLNDEADGTGLGGRLHVYWLLIIIILLILEL